MTTPFEIALSLNDAATLRRMLLRSIGTRLLDLNLSHWGSTITLWLWHYHDLDDRTFYEAHPVRDVDLLLGQALRERSAGDPEPRTIWSDAQFAGRLACLPFLAWRAKNGAGEEWVPLSQSFTDFVDGVAARDLRLWCSDRVQPASEVTTAWLLQQLDGKSGQRLRRLPG